MNVQLKRSSIRMRRIVKYSLIRNANFLIFSFTQLNGHSVHSTLMSVRYTSNREIVNNRDRFNYIAQLFINHYQIQFSAIWSQNVALIVELFLMLRANKIRKFLQPFVHTTISYIIIRSFLQLADSTILYIILRLHFFTPWILLNFLQTLVKMIYDF